MAAGQHRNTLALIRSLVNAVCTYDPIGYGMPYNYLLISEYSRDALTHVRLLPLLFVLSSFETVHRHIHTHRERESVCVCAVSMCIHVVYVCTCARLWPASSTAGVCGLQLSAQVLCLAMDFVPYPQPGDADHAPHGTNVFIEWTAALKVAAFGGWVGGRKGSCACVSE